MAAEVHPEALVEAEIGDGTRVWAFAHVMEGAIVGRECNIGEHAFIETGARVGDGVTVKNGAMIWEGVTIGDGVFVGPGVIFTNDRYPRSARLPEATSRSDKTSWLVPTDVGRGASLGAGAVIGPGAHIGAFAMVGAGAVVTQEVAPHAMVRGIPAVRVGWVCVCGEPLRFEVRTAACSGCGRVWSTSPGAVHPEGATGIEEVTS